MKIRYSSNNSGGYWWLSDKDWQALEDAGWEVEWGRLDYDDDEASPRYGKRRAQSLAEVNASGLRWLGAAATAATFHNAYSMEIAIEQWESVTGLSAEDKGCRRCGQPHYFSEEK